MHYTEIVRAICGSDREPPGDQDGWWRNHFIAYKTRYGLLLDSCGAWPKERPGQTQVQLRPSEKSNAPKIDIVSGGHLITIHPCPETKVLWEALEKVFDQ